MLSFHPALFNYWMVVMLQYIFTPESWKKSIGDFFYDNIDNMIGSTITNLVLSPAVVALAAKPLKYHLQDAVFIQFWISRTLLRCVFAEIQRKNCPIMASASTNLPNIGADLHNLAVDWLKLSSSSRAMKLLCTGARLVYVRLWHRLNLFTKSMVLYLPSLEA